MYVCSKFNNFYCPLILSKIMFRNYDITMNRCIIVVILFGPFLFSLQKFI